MEALHQSSQSQAAMDLLHRSAACAPATDAEACTVLDVHLACRAPNLAFLQVPLLMPNLRCTHVKMADGWP